MNATLPCPCRLGPGRIAARRFAFTLTSGKTTAIDLVADPERIGQLDLTILRDGG